MDLLHLLAVGSLTPEDLDRIKSLFVGLVSGMVDWKIISGAFITYTGAVGTGFKILWGKYQEAISERDKLQTAVLAAQKVRESANAVAAQAAAEAATTKATEALATLKEENETWLTRRDDLAQAISTKKDGEIAKWEKRYFDLEEEVRERVFPLIDKVKAGLIQQRTDLSKIAGHLTTALTENDNHLADSQTTLTLIDEKLAVLDSVLQEISRMRQEMLGGGD